MNYFKEQKAEGEETALTLLKSEDLQSSAFPTFVCSKPTPGHEAWVQGYSSSTLKHAQATVNYEFFEKEKSVTCDSWSC